MVSKTNWEVKEWRVNVRIERKKKKKTTQNAQKSPYWVHIQHNPSDSAMGPDHEGRWTRGGAQRELRRAAVSCAFDVGRCDGGRCLSLNC